MPWFKLTFTPEQIAVHQAMTLQKEVMVALLAFHAPANAALFCDDDGKDYYFTPAAVVLVKDLIVKYGGSECPPPKASNVPVKLLGDALADIPFAPET